MLFIILTFLFAALLIYTLYRHHWYLRSIIRMIPSLIKREKGIIGTFRWAIMLAFDEGWDGIQNHLRLREPLVRNFYGAKEYVGAPFNTSRRTLLVVSHEASRTGAPILCLNVIEHLKEKYNIVTVLLNGGILLEHFKSSSNLVLNLYGKNTSAVNRLIQKLLAKRFISFALVNSAVSHPTLPALGANLIPTVSLIHEFASYMRSHNNIQEIICCSSIVVFSSEIIFEDMRKNIPGWSPTSHVSILPQGRCVIKRIDPPSRMKVSSIRKLEWPHDTKIVLGAGSVQMRKGVDIFIQCAQQIINKSKDKNIRFIWVGNGYDPKRDMGYSVYIEEQIQRSGLEDYIEMREEMDSLERAYQEANLFLLTSRMDPLPNVGIDSICCGLPILCFEHGSGIAKILIDEGEKESCVCPYLDCSRMAEMAIRILQNADFYQSLSQHLIEIGRRRFDLQNYIVEIDSLLEISTAFNQEEKRAVQRIIKNKNFNLKDWKESVMSISAAFDKLNFVQAINIFVRGSSSGLPFTYDYNESEVLKPCPAKSQKETSRLN